MAIANKYYFYGMVEYATTILKFNEQGEKTGWTYIEVPADVAQELKPGNKKSFRVKGKLDNYPIEMIAIMPMGEGAFIMAINAAMRKGIAKKHGAMLQVQLEVDNKTYELNPDLMECLAEEPEGMVYFKGLAPSHQNYFSKWVESAKTNETKAKRIAQCVNAMVKKQTYSEMIRAAQADRKMLG